MDSLGEGQGPAHSHSALWWQGRVSTEDISALFFPPHSLRWHLPKHPDLKGLPKSTSFISGTELLMAGAVCRALMLTTALPSTQGVRWYHYPRFISLKKMVAGGAPSLSHG